MTVRRRFLLTPSFARLIQRERGGLRHVEGFFPEQRDRSAWIRLEEGRGLLILATGGPGGETEAETEIPLGHAHALFDVCAGAVDYSRTALPIGEGHALVDALTRPRVLHLVTVEFASDEEAGSFHPPEWFGPEVTMDRRYTYHALALRGLDAVPEIPLSNAALDSLLDTLDGRFPSRTRAPSHRATAKPTSAAKTKAQASAQAVQVDLDDIEAAMMREMEKTLQKSQPE